MCVILSIYQLNKDNELNKKISGQIISRLQEKNPDGTAVLALNFNKNFNKNIYYYNREFKIEKETIEKLLENYDILNIHLRLATSGQVNKNNIHFWKYKNWFFAHNGTIYTYHNEYVSDSLVFFRQLIKRGYISVNKIDVKKIKEFSREVGIWGRFILTNPITKKIYFFGDFYAISLDRKVLIISTQDINFYDYFTLMNIEFYKQSEIEKISRKVEGVFYINIKEKKFKQLDQKFLSSAYEEEYWNNRRLNYQNQKLGF